MDSNQVVIGTSGTDHLKVTSDGKVGIGLGTSNPTTALEINGALTVGNSVINNTGWNGNYLGLSHKSDTENNSFLVSMEAHPKQAPAPSTPGCRVMVISGSFQSLK